MVPIRGGHVIEQRRYARAPIDSPVSFAIKGKGEKLSGLGKDISVGGMFIETQTPAGFGSDVTIDVTLPGADGPLSLPGVVRWVRDGGMGVQFGLLGALETHVITEIGRKHQEASGR
ncbi:MAG: PilZ domain-containing protein [Labilithrix sp.]|nr:PilZ domain-containing protein [Labilithrix sp.]